MPQGGEVSEILYQFTREVIFQHRDILVYDSRINEEAVQLRAQGSFHVWFFIFFLLFQHTGRPWWQSIAAMWIYRKYLGLTYPLPWYPLSMLHSRHPHFSRPPTTLPYLLVSRAQVRAHQFLISVAMWPQFVVPPLSCSLLTGKLSRSCTHTGELQGLRHSKGLEKHKREKRAEL